MTEKEITQKTDVSTQIHSAAERLTKRGLGSLQPSGFYSKRFPCPKHGGEKANAVLNQHGFIHCHSRCGKIPIPEVMEIFGIENAPLSPTERRQYAETKAERQKKAAQAKRESMTLNQIKEFVADELRNLPVELYLDIFDDRVKVLLALWRDGTIQLDFGQPQPVKPILLTAQSDLDYRLNADQIAACWFAMSPLEAALTIRAADIYLDDTFTAADIFRGLKAAGETITDRQVRRLMNDCILFEPDGDKWRLTDRATITMRLEVRVSDKQDKIRYKRQAPLDAYENDDGFETVYDLRGDRKRPEYRGPEYDDLRYGDPVILPAHCPDGLLAWWWDYCLTDGETIGRAELYQRTGLTPYLQGKTHKAIGGGKVKNCKVIAAATPKEAIRESGLVSSFALPKGKYEWTVIGANTYVKNAERTFFDDSDNAYGEKMSADDTETDDTETPPAPILPKVSDSDTIYSLPYRTRALYYEWLDNDLLDIDDWRGKEVTLEALIAYQHERQTREIKLSDGSSIPF